MNITGSNSLSPAIIPQTMSIYTLQEHPWHAPTDLYVIMMVAVALAPNTHQVISNNHADYYNVTWTIILRNLHIALEQLNKQNSGGR